MPCGSYDRRPIRLRQITALSFISLFVLSPFIITDDGKTDARAVKKNVVRRQSKCEHAAERHVFSRIYSDK